MGFVAIELNYSMDVRNIGSIDLTQKGSDILLERDRPTGWRGPGLLLGGGQS